MERLDKILPSILKKKGLSKAAEGAEICFWANKWKSGLVESISFAKGLLKVRVPSASSACDLSFETDDLIDFVNKKMKRPLVRAVRILSC